MTDSTETGRTHQEPERSSPSVPRYPRPLAVSWAWSLADQRPSDRLVLAALAQHVDRFGCTIVGQRRLAELTGLSVRTVRSVLRRLTDRGVISRTRRISVHGGRTTDAILLQAWPERLPLPDDGHPRWGRRVAETIDSHLARLGAEVLRQPLPHPPETDAGQEHTRVNITTLRKEEDGDLSAALEALGPWATSENRAFLTADRAVLSEWRERGLDIGRDLVPILERRAATGRNPPVLRTWRYFEKALPDRLLTEGAPDAGRASAKMPVVSDGLLRRLVKASAIVRRPSEEG